MPSTSTLLRQEKFTVKWIGQKYYRDIECTVRGSRISVKFPYDKFLLDAVKTSFEGRTWDMEKKEWSFPITQRNLFQFELLQGKYGPEPKTNWPVNIEIQKEDIDAVIEGRGITLYQHQYEIISHILLKRQFLVAADMGLGKTLCTIVAMEILAGDSNPYILWVGPKGPLTAARLEFAKWRSPLRPEFMTYDALRIALQRWDRPTPQIFVMDEISCCKTATSQRTKACQYVADSMRDEKVQPMIVGLTGTPSPKTPVDWWAEVEIIRPGWITEKSPRDLQARLGVLSEHDDGITKFKKLETWKDSTDKCDICGKTEQEHANAPWDFNHPYVAGSDEVSAFGKRLRGPVGVWLKSDCLDLPEKRYECIQFEPTQEILSLARTVVNRTKRAADALIKLRTLSDGFLYEEVETGSEPCTECINGQVNISPDEMGPCAICSGSGRAPVMTRVTKEFACPKIDLLIQLLSEHEEVGRLCVYAGFQGSVDRIQKVGLQQGWSVFKADGRGWSFTTHEGLIPMTQEAMVERFQSKDDRIMFVGQPGAAGMGLTLTASPTTYFYSNDFNPQSRFQAEDRIHRIGMDVIRGGRIIDVIHLPSDEKVINSLVNSRNLQSITMDELRGYYV